MSRPQRVRVPWRVVTSSYYGDATVSVYVKIAALAQRPEGCTAGVAYLSGLLGTSRSSVERSLTQLMRPAPEDDVIEMTSYRRTLPGGRGTTAVRRVRQQQRSELGAWVPTRAAEALNPRQLRAYAAISYAVATGHPIALGELGQVLRHRTGKRAGQPLNARSVNRILRGLADLGWITVESRSGYRGRHTYTVHDEPLQLPLTADSDEGSGADLGEGSLAYKEDLLTDSPDDPAAGGSIRRRRDQVVARGPVEIAGPVPVPAALKGPYAGPELSLAPRIWRVLEPVHVLMAGLSTHVVRELAREAGRQLDQGVHPEQLRARLEFRFDSTQEIRNPAGWLLGPAIIHRGCGDRACESGVIWATGERCRVCAGAPPARRPAPRPPGPSGPPHPGPAYPGPPRWHECDDCGAPSRRPLHGGLCADCRPQPVWSPP